MKMIVSYWVVLFCVLTICTFPVKTELEEDDDEDHDFTFNCAGPELLTFYNSSTTKYQLTQCTPAVVCGQSKTCIQTSGPACPLQFQYLSGVEKTGKNLLFTCCQLSPKPDGQESCQETQVIDDSYEARELPPGFWKNMIEQMKRKQGGNPPTQRQIRNKRQAPMKHHVELNTDVFMTRLDTHHPPNQFLKSIKKVGRGHTVTWCTIQCSSTTTTTSTIRPSTQTQRQTQQPTQQPRQQPQQPKEQGHAKKGLFSGGHGCFSGDMTVLTPTGQRRMDELHVGDEVQILTSESSKSFQPIEWFYHRNPEQNIDYINLETKSGHRLSITANHLIPFVPCTPGEISLEDMDQLVLTSSFASRAKIGSCIGTSSGNGFIADPITRITTDRKRGVFSPITSQGTIVVNGVQTSCYSSLENQAVQRSIHGLLIKTNRIIQSMWHLISDRFSTGTGKMEEKDIPAVLGFLLEFAKRVLPAHVYN